MKQTLTTRALIALDGAGVNFRGTCHLPFGRAAESDLCESMEGRMGVLILNALASPRSGYADSAVHWADSFAAGGYPCFRFDLPGLGDTRGDLPAELLTFITDGGYASVIEQKVRELVDRFRLCGVVVMGHCAGAVTALHAASEQKACKGLVMMDPYFNYPRRITKIAPRVTELSRTSRVYKLLRKGYDVARELPRAIRKDGLPASANLPLLGQWKRVASSGLPILILGSPALKPGPGQFDYIRYALQVAGRRAEVTVQLIEQTDHSFANTAGKIAVREHVGNWLGTLASPHVRVM